MHQFPFQRISQQVPFFLINNDRLSQKLLIQCNQFLLVQFFALIIFILIFFILIPFYFINIKIKKYINLIMKNIVYIYEKNKLIKNLF